MAFTRLHRKPVYPALLPFAVYSTFHFLTYLCTNLIPTITPSAPNALQPAIAETVTRFVKNYDASMHLVANLELCGDALATDARVPEGAREQSIVSKMLGAGQTVKKE